MMQDNSYNEIDMEIDPAESDEWLLVGNRVEDGAPVFYNPDTQRLAWKEEAYD